MAIGAPLGVIQFCTLACFSKVYYQCNYIGDTAIGMVLGVVVGLLLHEIGL